MIIRISQAKLNREPNVGCVKGNIHKPFIPNDFSNTIITSDVISIQVIFVETVLVTMESLNVYLDKINFCQKTRFE